MTGKNKNIKTDFSGFLRYRGTKLSNNDRNAFERELEKDPFAAEADEGYQGSDQESVKNDLSALHDRLNSRTGRKVRIVYYRIAASVAVLLAAGSLLIFLPGEKQTGLISENINNEQPINIAKSPVLSEPVLAEKNKTSQENLRSADQNIERKKASEKTAGISQPVLTDTIKSEFQIAVPDEKAFLAEKKEAELKHISENQPTATKSVNVKEDSNLPISARAAERDLAGGVSTARAEKRSDISEYKAPQPVDGKDSFDKYIRENARMPEGTRAGQSDTVTVSFIVKSSGDLVNIRILKSPGKYYSDEALKLIKNGPAWMPAERNNIRKDDEVIIKIVFR